MDILLMSAIVGVLAFIGLLSVAYATIGRGIDFEERVRQVGTKETPSGSWRSYLAGAGAFFRPLGKVVPRSPEDMSRQQRRLVQGGIRNREAHLVFYGVQVAVALAVFAGFFASGYLQKNVLLFVVLSALLGAMVPDLWLSQRISRRKWRIQVALPDALDLMVVCVEAGLALDQTMLRIGQELRLAHPDLSKEFELFNFEVNAGQSRAQGLRNLATRTGVDDLKALVAVLIQTDRFGTSIAQSLRVFSDTMRTKRRQRAEEQAAKLAVKMIPPMVVFVFPSIFVVVAGPAVISIASQLLPMMRGQ